MKQDVNREMFIDSFKRMGRENQFTHGGLNSLYDWLIELEEETGREEELDVIALCCDFTEYKNLEELQKDYTDIKNLDDLEEHTTVIHTYSDSLIIQNF